MKNLIKNSQIIKRYDYISDEKIIEYLTPNNRREKYQIFLKAIGMTVTGYGRYKKFVLVEIGGIEKTFTIHSEDSKFYDKMKDNYELAYQKIFSDVMYKHQDEINEFYKDLKYLEENEFNETLIDDVGEVLNEIKAIEDAIKRLRSYVEQIIKSNN